MIRPVPKFTSSVAPGSWRSTGVVAAVFVVPVLRHQSGHGDLVSRGGWPGLGLGLQELKVWRQDH